ncbi:phage portal protein [Microbispora bryophytorum]|uniref:phage portal protein n=1 Tax=Microbispora bryophytorum TaxID=1460882 RepID=UPI0033EC603C
MGLLEKVAKARAATTAQKAWSEPNFWDLDALRFPFLGASSFNGEREEIENDFEGYVSSIYKSNGPVFALIAVRMLVFSQARFMFRRRRDGRPGDLHATSALQLLERPWTNGTTGDLLARVLQDADLAGNAYVANLNGRLRRLRPDWVTIAMHSESEPDLNGDALDAELLGYWYSPRRRGVDQETFLLPNQVAHFAPIPDPTAHWRGMSWLTPVLQEISADLAATKHKLGFFENGATPSFVVRLDASVTPDMAKRFKAVMEDQHKGVKNAGKVLYLGGGADVTPLTVDMQRLDFKAVQGAGESRLASVAGVPPIIVGFSEGLSGSSLNAGNYGAAKRRFVDATMRPLWANIAGSLAPLVSVPADSELWWDDKDIAFLREDARDRADIEHTKASTIRQLVDAGYIPDSVVAAVEAEDMTLLEHSGLYSVQLQPPGVRQGDPSNQPPGDPAGGQ